MSPRPHRMIRIGTSGFSYKEWVGSFYPARMAGSKMLAFYAQRMPTVEINYTFRAMPRPAMLEGWAAQTPEHFRFALKAPQRITHFARLRGSGSEVDHFATTARVIEPRLAPVLFQLPPGFRKDLPLLREFLAQWNRRLMAAFEFRDPAWFEDDVLAALGEGGCALCIAESDTLAAPIATPARYAYLRLRRGEYGDADLERWADQIAAMQRTCDDIYVYLKHASTAPALAEKLTALVGARLP